MYPATVPTLVPPTQLTPVAAAAPHPLAVLGGDTRVRVADGRTLPYANLDVAATAPCAVAAADAVTRLLPTYASVHRGAGALSQQCTRAYEQARATVAGFVGCRPGDQVIFTRNSTDALNLMAHVVPAGTTVITFVGEHHANLLPWRRAVRLPLPRTPDEAVAAVERALRRPGPALVAVTATSNVTGEVWPVAEIARVAHQRGARVVVDAAQLAAHGPVDMAALGADYLVLSGHKLYAPFGAGVLAGRADWLDAAEPYLRGGGASRQVAADGAVRWADGPARHEAGTPNLVGVVALAAVCSAVTAGGWAHLARHERWLLERLDAGLSGIAGVHRLALFGPGHPRLGIAGFAVAGLDSAEVARRLADEHGIGVRDGLFCAHPLTRRLLADTPVTTATAVRASIGAGTTAEHVDRLVAGVADIAGRRRPASG
ncbi:aminotransferase class V-fold PLP-dependent enzyme [Krasilnikovia sp. M28-CT-15]|uniref:aminotransferase class V-fold PLP-dependent enzyme n=1 Tax=Krasilnikovia sp. M28-CT-15 TaxID=3373540 RepID=UPI003875EC63